MSRYILLVFLIGLFGFAHAQSDKTLVRQGNKSYNQDNFTNAELDYRKALDKNPNSLSGSFNLADAIYQQEDYQKSAELFANIGNANIPVEKKAMAYYNLGNSLLKGQQYEQSIEAYKMALRNNPNDPDARYNLEYARKMLKQQQNQDKQKDNKDQQKQDKDQEKKDQENKDKEKDKQDKQDQNQQNPQENQDNKGNPEQQMNDQQSKQISKKDAERMLEALKNNEKKTLEKLKKQKMENVRVVKKEKDW